MAYQYTISKGNQKLSMFQNEEYIDLNLKDIELFCEDYICQNFESRTKEETLFRGSSDSLFETIYKVG